MSIPSIRMNDGRQMPVVGFGAALGTDTEAGVKVLLEAFKAGYRHIDTAYLYGSEPAVGEAIRQSGIPREDLFIVTKLWNVHHSNVAYGMEKSLQALGLDYVDLYIMHWPQSMDGDIDAPGPSFKEEYANPMNSSPTYLETYKQMEELVRKGKARSIGVSNFSVEKLEKLLKEATIKPVTNQESIEGHLYLPQARLTDFCVKNNIIPTAWSPLSRPSPDAKPSILTEPVVLDLAKKYDVTPANIGLSWLIQRGWAVIPLSTNTERMKSNLKIVKLEPEDMEALWKIHTEPGKLGRGREMRAGKWYGPGDKCMGSTMEELEWLPND